MLITLLTDFGTADYFVAAMKGVILSRAPRATLVDVTHEVPPHDVRAGAFTLLSIYREFPPGTIHLAVVDPGVGSSRRPLVVSAGGQHFVGPDNGLFGWVCEREPDARAFHVTNAGFFRAPVSATFHGRDVFAPVAAALACGASPSRLGHPVTDFERLESIRPVLRDGGAMRGTVLHVDRFGNLVTSFARGDLPDDAAARGLRLAVGGAEVHSLRRFYAEAEPGEVFAIWGSAGFLEVSAFRDSAARLLGAAPGDEVIVSVG